MAKKVSKKKTTAKRSATKKPVSKEVVAKKAVVKKPHPARAQLLKFALTLPEAWEDRPWGESVAKVKKKVFVFFGVEKSGVLGLGVKLPDSGKEALEYEGVEPAGYGLGKSGWVSAQFERGDEIDMDELRDWIVESYCAIAPKTLVKLLDA